MLAIGHNFKQDLTIHFSYDKSPSYKYMHCMMVNLEFLLTGLVGEGGGGGVGSLMSLMGVVNHFIIKISLFI